jgi:single-strand DNA-binding protein
LGNVGQAPEIRESQAGKFATFNLATTDRGFIKQDGTQVPERTEWHNCVVFGKQAETVEKYVGKGMRLYVEGKLRTRKYTARDNTEKYVTEIVVDNFEMLSCKKEEGAPNVPFMNQQNYQQRHGGYPYPPSMEPQELNDMPY